MKWIKTGAVIFLLFLALLFLYYYSSGDSLVPLNLSRSRPLETSPPLLNSKNIEEIKDTFRRLVNQSRKEILIAGLYITSNLNRDILKEIKKAVKRGVHIKFLLDDSEFSRKEFFKLGLARYKNVRYHFLNVA
ncbi:MAG: hypothetical protein PHF84_03760, partial [bacterium]|nr:hypothetical protein [bacterium]